MEKGSNKTTSSKSLQLYSRHLSFRKQSQQSGGFTQKEAQSKNTDRTKESFLKGMFAFLFLEMLEKQEIIRNMYRFYLQHNYQTMLWVNAYANINANVDI